VPTQPIFAGGAPGAASKDGDPLEALAGTVEFERYPPLLIRGLAIAMAPRRPNAL
jgi:hypothetical protein